MKACNRNKRGESGQAAIEFITVIIVVFFFLFFFLSLSILLVVSNYMDYATFMAARTFKSGYSTQAFQERYARQEFFKYAQRVEGIARNIQVNFVQAAPGDEQTWGAVSDYTVDLFYLPPIFVSQAFPGSQIRLRSEAFLGRDPAFEDCISFFDRFAARVGLGISGSGLVQQMADNGC